MARPATTRRCVRGTRYTLSPGVRGGSVLRRRVIWQRHLAPDSYFGWLQQTVMERAQVRLLELIRNRADIDYAGRAICSR